MKARIVLLAVVNLAISHGFSYGAFHFMQIEQIIGGVNGDTTAQAIQLRMRANNQNTLSSARLSTVNAAGANQVVLQNLTTNVAVGQTGRRVLIATPNFANYTDVPLVADFVMTPIPVSYLAAGQVRFTNNNGGVIYWSLSWGGSGFTGSTTGNATNDSDGNFGPPVNIALPTESLQALQFTGAANALSTNNLADYALTAGAATFTNNAGTSFTLVVPDPPSADFDNDGDVDGRDFLVWQRGESPNFLSPEDLELWQEQYGAEPVMAVTVPEGASLSLLIGMAVSKCIVCRRRRV